MGDSPPAGGRREFDLERIERDRILGKAARFLREPPRTVTADRCERCAGGPHDFYSEGVYWWPRRGRPHAPYAPRDGRSNPGNFLAHRRSSNTHPYGEKEKLHPNNHGICWSLQAAAFADLLGDESQLDWVRERFTAVFLGRQMDQRGGFPAELGRTKPYSYSLFVIDAMAGIAQIASRPGCDLWKADLPDGRGLGRAVDFIYPFIVDKSTWPRRPDVEYWNEWPVRQPSLLFAGLNFERGDYLETWESLEPDPTTFEILRNLPIRHPLLWLK